MTRELKPHGTNAAYVRHIKAGEQACAPCKAAHTRDEQARLAGTLPPPELKPCGTLAAERRHRAHGEPVDEACRQAALAYYRESHASRRRKAAFEAALAEVLAEVAS